MATKKVKLWDDLTTAQKIKRWEGVLRVLKSLTPAQRKKNFDMRTFGERGPECGMIGCIGGLCGVDRSFNRQGFVSMFGAYSNPEGEPYTMTDGKVVDMAETFVGFTVGPESFFGNTGVAGVFYAVEETPDHGTAVERVKAHIRDLEMVDKLQKLQEEQECLDNEIAELEAFGVSSNTLD